MGQSSGDHLSLSMAFRLKRYGIVPHGIYSGGAADRLSRRFFACEPDLQWRTRRSHATQLSHVLDNYRLSLPNHATVLDCVGLPPVFIHTIEFNLDCDNCLEFYGKLLDAKAFAEFHCWAGAHHMSDQLIGSVLPGEPNEYAEHFCTILDAKIPTIASSTICAVHGLSRGPIRPSSRSWVR